MTANIILKASPREKTGSAEARRARRAGQVPAVICNKGGENIYISVDSKEFEQEYLKGNIFTTVVSLELGGKKIEAIPHKIELNPVTDRPIHVDFIKFEKNDSVKAKVKINFVGTDKSPGLKKGGFLHIVLRKLELICNPNSIPTSIDIDVSAMQVGAKVRSSKVGLPNDVKFAQKGDFLICSIIGRGSKDEETTGAAAEGAAAPAAAAPAAAKAGDAKAAPAAGAKAAPAAKPAAKK